MADNKLKFTGIFALAFMLILLSGKNDDRAIEDLSVKDKAVHTTTFEAGSNNIGIFNNESKDKPESQADDTVRIIRGSSIEMIGGRRPYELSGREITLKHFVVRVTTPDNPFLPHKHQMPEMWFIIKGEGKVLLKGIEYDVEENDLIILDPWVEHGLRTESEVTWICLG